MSYTKLQDATRKNVALALGVSGDSSVIATKLANMQMASGDKGFALPVENLGFIADHIYEGNPLDFYTSGISFSTLGNGAVEMKYNKYNAAWEDKTSLGANAKYNSVEVASEILKWNKPKVLQEGIPKYDLHRGAPLKLADRLSVHGKSFMQNSIKEGFAEMVKAAVAGKASSALTKAMTTTQQEAATLLMEITRAATAYLKALQAKGIEFTGYDRSDIVITLSPEVLDSLSFAGLLGNKVEQTFAGGRFIITTAGGYRVVSGDFFLPAEAAASNELYGVIATNDTLAFNIDVLAANVERLQPSNDVVSYAEMANFIAVTQRAKDNDMISLLVQSKIV